MKKTAEIKRAKAFVEASFGPWGRLSAERTLRDQIGTIEAWRHQGARWDQIAAILYQAGWRNSKGAEIGADALRAMASRARRSMGRSTGEAGLPYRDRADVSRKIMRSIGTPVKRNLIDIHPAEGQQNLAERIRRAALLRGGNF